MTQGPLVTIMIATKDRPKDLAFTLWDIRRQNYPNLELIVLDDASNPPIEAIVKQHWPEARLVRHETNRGQSASRNEGFRLAKGKYILQLDDDCSLPAAAGISMSVQYMETTPSCAGIAYRDFKGQEMPTVITASAMAPGNCVTFIGAAVFLRRAALEETAGYRDFFVGYAEEQELCLQLLKRGRTFSYRPEIAALHRCSPSNRDRPTAWKRTLRNNLWTILIHSPMSRIPAEVGWKVIMGAWDALRLRRAGLFYEALRETITGFTKVWKLRDPLDRLSLRRYDAFRAYGILPYEMYAMPPESDWRSLLRWARYWGGRLRESSVESEGTESGGLWSPSETHDG